MLENAFQIMNYQYLAVNSSKLYSYNSIEDFK